MEKRVREGNYRSEAAGHLMAELLRSKDEWSKGWITNNEMLKRIAEIRDAKDLVERSENDVLTMIIGQLKEEYEGSEETGRAFYSNNRGWPREGAR